MNCCRDPYNEIRNFDEISKGETAKLSDAENQLALGLMDQLTTEDFDLENYRDEYRDRVLAFLDEKSKGEIVTPPRCLLLLKVP